MSRLENRYRLLLRVLPAWYRAEREEEMLGVFLADRTDDLDLEYGWPGWAETWPILGLAFRARLDGPPRAAAVGAVVRLVAVIGLLMQSVLLMGAVAGLAMNFDVRVQMSPYQLIVVAVVPVAAFVSLVTGHRVLARILAAVALVPGLIALSSVFTPHDMVVPQLWSAMVVNAPLWLTVACLIAGFHDQAPMPPAKPWLRALAVGSVLAVVCVVATTVVPPYPSDWWAVFDFRALLGWGVLVSGVVLLVRRAAVPALALSVCAISLLPERLTMLAYFAPAASVVQAAGLVAVAVSLAALGIRDFHRLANSRSAPAASEPGSAV